MEEPGGLNAARRGRSAGLRVLLSGLLLTLLPGVLLVVLAGLPAACAQAVSMPLQMPSAVAYDAQGIFILRSEQRIR